MMAVEVSCGLGAPNEALNDRYSPHAKTLGKAGSSAAGTWSAHATGGLGSNRDRFSDRRPPPPMLIHQNNPMQSSRRLSHECFEKQFDTSGKSAAFLHHSATL
jgi:hypothetical protein